MSDTPPKKRDPRGAKPKDPSGKTQAQLAQEAGVSLETWKSWRRLRGTTGEDLANRKKEAEIVRIETATAKEQRMLAVLDELYAPRQVVDEAGAALGAIFTAFAASARTEVPPMVAGLSEAEAEVVLTEWADGWLERARDEQSKLWDDVRAHLQTELRGDLKKVAAKRKEGGA